MKKWIYRALIVLFAAIFIGSASYVAIYFINSNKAAKNYTELQNIKEQSAQTPRPTIPQDNSGNTDPTSPTTPSEPPDYVDVTDPDTGDVQQILPEFSQLYEMNNDLVGWIQIPGTEINYPVMQTPDRPNYYLTRNFDKEDSAHGAIYVRETCDVNAPSDNVTIYGHRMRDGSMFYQLENYKKKSFFENNRYIYFDTLTEFHTYEIIAIFTTTATVGEGFAYHHFENAKNEAEFDEFVSTCKELSFYDTGVTAEYGDKLITLSTCEYSQTNGRLVVVAKRII